MVQKAFVWATFPLAIALLFGIVWAVGSYVPDACTAWFDGPGGAPRRLSPRRPNLVLADNNNLWHFALCGWDGVRGYSVRPVPPGLETPWPLG